MHCGAYKCNLHMQGISFLNSIVEALPCRRANAIYLTFVRKYLFLAAATHRTTAPLASFAFFLIRRCCRPTFQCKCINLLFFCLLLICLCACSSFEIRRWCNNPHSTMKFNFHILFNDVVVDYQFRISILFNPCLPISY